MRLIKLLFVSACLLVFSSCGGKGQSMSSYSSSSIPSQDEPDDGRVVVVSELKHLNNGKTVVYVDDKPFKSIGIQIRTDALMNCDHLKLEELEPFFAKAGELGINTVEVPVEWKDIEVGDNVFDFTYMDTIMSYAYKYDLKIELLWFGTNMCGDTHSYSVPEYILCDGKTYPKLDALRTGEFWGYYGIQWFMDFSNDNLIDRESKAITRTMNHIYNYDKERGEQHPIISFQVLNEADIFARFRLAAKQVVSPTTLEIMTEEEAWDMTLKALNAYGKAVKNSKYIVYTRTNLAASTGSGYGISYDNSFSKASIKLPPEWARKIFELEGIDAVGDDPYTKKVKEIKGVSYMYGENLPGNYPHIAENAGDYTNIPSLMLAALSVGAGYNMYDLATPPFFIAHASSSTVDQGICTYKDGQLTNRSHFAAVQKTIKGINKCGDTLVTFNKGDMIGFNINTGSPLSSTNQTINTSQVVVDFSTSDGAYGFAVSDNTHMDLYCVGTANVNIGNVHITDIKAGYYNQANEFVGESVTTSSSFTAESEVLYRIEFDSIQNVLTSNYWENIGGNEG